MLWDATGTLKSLGHEEFHNLDIGFKSNPDLANATCVGADQALFPVLFELVSAFGNVGLSMGTYAHTDDASDPLFSCSFAADLNTGSQALLVLTMIIGRCRAFPSRVDSSLALHYTTEAELLRDLDDEGDKRQLATACQQRRRLQVRSGFASHERLNLSHA